VDLQAEVKSQWARRPVWLNLVLLFCLYMTFVYSPFDVLFKPLETDEDVWFGFMFHGWPAKVGGVVWAMNPWAWLLGSLYATQVAMAMFLWPLIQTGTAGLLGGVIAGALFAVPAVAFWRSKPLF